MKGLCKLTTLTESYCNICSLVNGVAKLPGWLGPWIKYPALKPVPVVTAGSPVIFIYCAVQAGLYLIFIAHTL